MAEAGVRPPPIRAITVGVADPHPLSATAITEATASARTARATFEADGYEVQSTRLSTRPILEDLGGWSAEAIVDYAAALERRLRDEADDLLLSVGAAPADDPAFGLDRLEILADLLVGTSFYGTVQLATPAHVIRAEAALPAARIALRLSRETDEGFGCFRFAALACVEPGAPFFPAGYHRGAPSLSIGWQGAGVVAAAAAETVPGTVTERVREAITSAGRPIVELGRRVAGELGVEFGGLDVSPAPAGDDSIGQAVESFGYGPVGSPGTLTAVAAITSALRTADLPTCGYSGLMLPVMEDAVLARRWAEGSIGIDQLLAYSAICGTGLDAVPLPGGVSEQEVAAIYLDVATLAMRLNKPLSARLMPVPGKDRGQLTTFTSPYLVNTRV